MALLKVLRQHISADGAYRAVGETYEDANTEHVALRVEGGIVEVVTAKGKSKKKDDADAGDDHPAGETGEQTSGVQDAGLIED